VHGIPLEWILEWTRGRSRDPTVAALRSSRPTARTVHDRGCFPQMPVRRRPVLARVVLGCGHRCDRRAGAGGDRIRVLLAPH